MIDRYLEDIMGVCAEAHKAGFNLDRIRKAAYKLPTILEDLKTAYDSYFEDGCIKIEYRAAAGYLQCIENDIRCIQEEVSKC